MSDWTPGDPLLPPGLWVRPLFEVIEDNPDLWWHGEARWPEPLPGHDIGWDGPGSHRNGPLGAERLEVAPVSHPTELRAAERQPRSYERGIR